MVICSVIETTVGLRRTPQRAVEAVMKWVATKDTVEI